MQIQFPTIPAATTSTRSASGRETSAVDFQSFLRLLTAQLRNQDPLSPIDSTQFVAQLASFSTVEQLVSANTQLGAISERLTSDGIEEYAGWVGRTAEIEGAPVRFDGAPVQYRVDPRANAASVELVARDANGVEVHRSTIANDGAVKVWTGTGAQPGAFYSLQAEFIDADGVSGTVAASTFGAIQSVRQTAAGTLFTLSNGLSAPREAIRGIGLGPGQ